MPFYNTATVAAAIGVTPKWLDNLLSHHNISGLERDAQGVSRRLSAESIGILTLTKELIDTLELSAPAALRLATRLLANNGERIGSPLFQITIDRDAMASNVRVHLARAVEIAPTPHRGRPPKR